MLADDAQVDVYAFGIATDFRGRLFPGSARLFELADEVSPLQVEVLCWCGRIGRFNGRVVDGQIVREGATVVVADTGTGASGCGDGPLSGAVPDPPPLRECSDRTRRPVTCTRLRRPDFGEQACSRHAVAEPLSAARNSVRVSRHQRPTRTSPHQNVDAVGDPGE